MSLLTVVLSSFEVPDLPKALSSSIWKSDSVEEMDPFYIIGSNQLLPVGIEQDGLHEQTPYGHSQKMEPS